MQPRPYTPVPGWRNDKSNELRISRLLFLPFDMGHLSLLGLPDCLQACRARWKAACSMGWNPLAAMFPVRLQYPCKSARVEEQRSRTSHARREKPGSPSSSEASSMEVGSSPGWLRCDEFNLRRSRVKFWQILL